jgi:hypothetical protein
VNVSVPETTSVERLSDPVLESELSGGSRGHGGKICALQSRP